ncbi:hypothetical protein ACIQNU_03380 [Streptomyces sp. NPDC091292]|uniref:hypothetical protein n=1 Tax=Streptomyces sp. NPDC091292 TaxID=3365991 RepID=UPI003826C0B0
MTVKTVALYVLEILSLGCVVLGVWCVYPPAGLILGGAVGVLGSEAALSERRGGGKAAGG